MRVAEDYSRKSCGSRIKIEFLNIVDDIETHTSDLQHIRFGKVLAPGCDINVSPDRRDRRKLAQLAENRGIANVAGMHDGICSAQRR